MTPNFTKGNKQLLITPGRMIRIYHTPDSKIDDAIGLVTLALDRKLPFAYKTVKPMYYLEYEGMSCDKYGKNKRYWYKECVSFDKTTRDQFMNNYYKLKRALRLLHDEGYVKTYWVRNDRRRFRCIWYADKPNQPLNVTEIHYGQFPPDYKSPPHVLRYKLRKKYARRELMSDTAIHAMRQAFPSVYEMKQIDPDRVVPNGKVQPYIDTSDDGNGGEWDAHDMVMREEANRIHAGNNINIYQQGKELRHWFIAVIAYYTPVSKLGKVVNTYA